MPNQNKLRSQPYNLPKTKKASRQAKIIFFVGVPLLLITGSGLSVTVAGLNDKASNSEFLPELSAYHIYLGKPNDMVPGKNFHNYQLATTLFTDYAYKQRLIRLPEGKKIITRGADLPEFPDSTILVKTFFYYTDERDTSKGKKMIETRLMIRSKGKWHLGTFVWNAQQTEAFCQKKGSDSRVVWINSTGEKEEVIYKIPSVSQCGTCHRSAKEIIPIGPKLRNMNFDVNNNGRTENQLTYFQGIGLLNLFDPRDLESLPEAFNPKFTIAEQARAYMEMNCAHCHNANGYCKGTGLYLQYSLPLEQTNILRDRNRIMKKTSSGLMPLLGKTVIHKEGVAVIRAYIMSLN